MEHWQWILSTTLTCTYAVVIPYITIEIVKTVNSTQDIFIQNSFSWIYILCHSFIQVPPKKLWDPFFHASPSTSQLLVDRSRDQISNVYLPLDVYTSHKIGKINYVHNVIIRLKMLINCNSNSVNQREMPSSIQIYLHDLFRSISEKITFSWRWLKMKIN